jgi:hypothetical protein
MSISSYDSSIPSIEQSPENISIPDLSSSWFEELDFIAALSE